MDRVDETDKMLKDSHRGVVAVFIIWSPGRRALTSFIQYIPELAGLFLKFKMMDRQETEATLNQALSDQVSDGSNRLTEVETLKNTVSNLRRNSKEVIRSALDKQSIAQTLEEDS
ncbi:hypothetical protein Bca101_063720 [Brassica carinata]